MGVDVQLSLTWTKAVDTSLGGGTPHGLGGGATPLIHEGERPPGAPGLPGPPVCRSCLASVASLGPLGLVGLLGLLAQEASRLN